MLQAVYAYQGPEIQRDVAELQRGILDAQKVLVSATEHLQKADVVGITHLTALFSLDIRICQPYSSVAFYWAVS